MSLLVNDEWTLSIIRNYGIGICKESSTPVEMFDCVNSWNEGFCMKVNDAWSNER